jgi:hypothetical protein
MSNNGVIWIMSNNGGVGEIIPDALLSLAEHALLSLAERIMHLSCILILPSHWPSHALLSLAELVMHFSCTTKVQP